MPREDPFSGLAKYYDTIMTHVNYERWYLICRALANLAPAPLLHIDLACGTGTLVKMLREIGWTSFGLDLSPSMLQAGFRGAPAARAAVADLRALPLHGSASYVTCLFDSLNFLLDIEAVRRAFAEMYTAMVPGGLLYFDVVTARMVTDYFAGDPWTEDNGGFTTTWHSTFDKNNGLAETRVRVNQGLDSVIAERVYPLEQIQAAVLDAGFELLGVYDAETWGPLRKRTVRIDFTAMKMPQRRVRQQFRRIASAVRRDFAGG